MPSLAETGPIKGSRQDVVNVQLITYIIIHVHQQSTILYFIEISLKWREEQQR